MLGKGLKTYTAISPFTESDLTRSMLEYISIGDSEVMLMSASESRTPGMSSLWSMSQFEELRWSH